MLISVFARRDDDFTTNGLGPVFPTTCTVTETLNGEYTLELTHIYDNEGRWTRLQAGNVIMVPVPRSSTPILYELKDKMQSLPIYKIVGIKSTKTLKLYSEGGGQGSVLAKYKLNTKVYVVNTDNSKWYQVITSDRKQGYLDSTKLEYTGQSETIKIGEYLNALPTKHVSVQPFRIRKISKNVDSVSVSARHLYYDLADKIIFSRNITGASTCKQLADDLDYEMPVDTTFKTLKYGNTGSKVKTLQKRLISLGFNISPYATGNFYENTQAALKKFEKKYGLTQDGIYSYNDHLKMLEVLGTPLVKYKRTEFSFYSDIDTKYYEYLGYTAASYVEDIHTGRRSISDYVSGSTDSLISCFGGELYRDTFDVYIMKRIGNDLTDSVVIRYGKDLLSYDYEEEWANVVTHLYVLPPRAESDTSAESPTPFVSDRYNEDADAYPHDMEGVYEYPDAEVGKVNSAGKKITADMSAKMIENKARLLFAQGIDLPEKSIRFSFINRDSCLEYEDYEKLGLLNLGDTITVLSAPHDVKVSMRVTQYTYDCLKGEYTDLTLGVVQNSLYEQITRSF